ncbi:MAG: hypothetical protein AB1589_46260 [Cyanobacteriota bacterium]
MGTYNGTNGDNYKEAVQEINDGSPWKWWDEYYEWKSWAMSGKGGNDTLIGGLKDDTLNGNEGNDRLNGYGYYATSDTQYDILVGGSGGDTFVLGGSSWGVSYQGLGHATIKDFNWEEDKFEVIGETSNYSLGTGNWSGNNNLDTGIFYEGDLIAVVEDKSGWDVMLPDDFIFV